MHVVFYNFYHAGDLFFIKEILDIIAKANPEHEFYLSIDSCSSLYQKTALKVIPTSRIWKEVRNAGKYFYDVRHDNLYVDTWAGRHHYRVNNIKSICEGFDRMMDEIHDRCGFRLKLGFEPRDYRHAAPTLPYVPIELSAQQDSIFYYNMDSNSAQCPNYNHNYIITCLTRAFPSRQIIVPKPCGLNTPGLMDLSRQGITETTDASNLIQYAQIAKQCEIVILKDCGGCFFHFCRQNMLERDSPQNVIVVSTRDDLVEDLSYSAGDNVFLHDVQLDSVLHLRLETIIRDLGTGILPATIHC